MLLVSLVSNNLSNYKRRHFKLFTNCHVSWDTQYIILREPHRMRQEVGDNDDDIKLFKGTDCKGKTKGVIG